MDCCRPCGGVVNDLRTRLAKDEAFSFRTMMMVCLLYAVVRPCVRACVVEWAACTFRHPQQYVVPFVVRPLRSSHCMMACIACQLCLVCVPASMCLPVCAVVVVAVVVDEGDGDGVVVDGGGCVRGGVQKSGDERAKLGRKNNHRKSSKEEKSAQRQRAEQAWEARLEWSLLESDQGYDVAEAVLLTGAGWCGVVWCRVVSCGVVWCVL